MNKSEEIRKLKEINISKSNKIISKFTKNRDETERVRDILDRTPEILEELDLQFEATTGLTKVDVAFLFTAIGLQIVRQYLVTKFPARVDDQTSAKNTVGHIIEHSNRHHKYYNPSLEEIISNPVPFDAIINSKGALKGGYELGHRITAIGHDPILGLIFGTANIATSTLTTNTFQSYHIATNPVLRKDYFKNKALTSLVIGNTIDKLLNQGIEGKKIIAASLIKEIIHLKSDINTTDSLPLPFIPAINSKLASDLASYGFDMSNVVAVGKQASYAILINTIIAMVHALFYYGNTDMDRKLYEVRTRKILSYSNLVASSSNIAVVAITKDFNNLDIGGIAVAIFRLITDSKFIRDVKEEFIFGNYKKMIDNEY